MPSSFLRLLQRRIPRRYLLAARDRYMRMRKRYRRTVSAADQAPGNDSRLMATPLAPVAEITNHRFGKIAGPRKKVSFVYNYYSKADTVFKSLESIDRQRWNGCTRDDIEIILIDDGSPGESIAGRLPDDVVYLWQRKIGYGICRAKNTGARLANGDYLVFLDPDILLAPEYVDSMLEGFAAFGDRTVQCGYIWDYHFVGCPDPRMEFGVWENPGIKTRRFYQVAGGNLAIARSLYFESPGFDEDLIYGGVEDLLFGYHLSKLAGTSIVFNSRMQSKHIPHPPSGAHADPRSSWDIVQLKWPEFYDDYIVRGYR